MLLKEGVFQWNYVFCMVTGGEGDGGLFRGEREKARSQGVWAFCPFFIFRKRQEVASYSQQSILYKILEAKI